MELDLEQFGYQWKTLWYIYTRGHEYEVRVLLEDGNKIVAARKYEVTSDYDPCGRTDKRRRLVDEWQHRKN